MEKVIKVNSVVTNYVDPESGELLDSVENHLDILVDSDDFMLVYSKFWNSLMESKLSKSDIELFAHLVSCYASGVSFSITSYVRTEVSTKTGKPAITYNNSPKHLVDNKFIYEVAPRVYKINPEMAFKGSSKNRNKLVVTMISKN